ncbi:MAG TPA: MBL fold metallo-hydrolase [Nannocystaceae bacterium]|nr:MBL fold metallo-hydrolase [Nannocystaceae bacterium]
MRLFPLAVVAFVLGCGDDAPESSGTSSSTTLAPTTSASTTAGATTSASTTTSATTQGDTSTSASAEVGEASSDGESTTGGPSATLEVHWIDTEGGAATLFVTPGGSIVLVDTGFPGDRDADRIAKVVQDDLGHDGIDLVVITHYHLDHVGGVPDLAARMPIAAFWDHGDSVEAGGGQGQELWEDYLAVADGKRTVVAPGEVHDVDGLEISIVSAARNVLAAALPGAGGDNPACDGASNMGVDYSENASSVGFVARFGSFEMLDLGDLTWSFEDELACPLQNVGTVDLYQTTHHGLAISGATQLVHALDPVVVVMNNGAHKGGESATFDRLAAIPSMPELWTQHRALDNDDAHNAPEERIANLEDGGGDQGFAVTAVVDSDGRITVTNARNGHAREYQAR